LTQTSKSDFHLSACYSLFRARLTNHAELISEAVGRIPGGFIFSVEKYRQRPSAHDDAMVLGSRGRAALSVVWSASGHS
jgi:hypothetical protein